jgi:hypothetical protein
LWPELSFFLLSKRSLSKAIIPGSDALEFDQRAIYGPEVYIRHVYRKLSMIPDGRIPWPKALYSDYTYASEPKASSANPFCQCALRAKLSFHLARDDLPLSFRFNPICEAISLRMLLATTN